MAGKRQHYIPQFLQRGFLAESRKEENGECTWWHFRGNPSRLQPIRHIGVKEYFYSRLSSDGRVTLDDIITQQEQKIQNELATIKSCSTGEILESARVSKFAVHFALRAAYLRSIFDAAGKQLIAGAVSLFSTPEGARSQLGLDGAQLNCHFSSALKSASESAKKNGLDIPPPLLERLAFYYLRENPEELTRDIQPAILKAQEIFIKGLPETIATAHQKALSNGNHTAWEDRLAALNWRLYDFESVVLPDCVVIAKDISGNWAPVLLSKEKEVVACIFPITCRRALVGTNQLDFALTAREINEASARCSSDFFIASRPMDELSPMLAGRSREIILDHVEDALNELKGQEQPPPSGGTELGLKGQRSDDFSFTLSTPNFTDESHSATLEIIVKSVVKELSLSIPLDSLDGVTFAVDYHAALEQLDPGKESESPSRDDLLAYGVSVSKCVSVVRGGKKKEHLVLGPAIADGFLSGDLDQERSSLQILVSMLAHIAHGPLYANTIIDNFTSFPNDFIELLNRATCRSPSNYYASRISAFADPLAGERYSILFRDCLENAHASISSALRVFENSNDVDLLISEAIKHSGNIINHAAQWCGYLDGMSAENSRMEIEPDEHFMRDTLETHELTRWLDLFHQDLRKLYESPQSFTADRILSLVCHAERIIWRFNIFPWPMENGGTYITVIPTIENEP